MTSDGRFVVGNDDVRVIQLLGKCSELTQEYNRMKEKRDKEKKKHQNISN